MEAQVANEAVVKTPSIESNPQQKPSLLKRTPKWVLYALGALIVAALLAFGYTQHWFKLGKLGTTDKSVEAVSAVAPAAAPVAAPEAAPTAEAAADVGLVQARQAYASGDVQGAINAYRELLTKNPNDIAAMGELGNVLYATGGSTQAAQTYFDAANLALAKGDQQLAESLLPVIEEGNPMLADQLHDRLFDAQMVSTPSSKAKTHHRIRSTARSAHGGIGTGVRSGQPTGSGYYEVTRGSARLAHREHVTANL